jgi:hypothetical protein
VVLALKCFQRLAHFPRATDVPGVVVDHVRGCLALGEAVVPVTGTDRTSRVHHDLIRARVGVVSDPQRAPAVAAPPGAVRETALVKNNPADLTTAKLDRDWQHLTAFYDFPAEHSRHLRTSNAIESSFATVKLRTRVTKGAGSKKAALTMAYNLLDAAQERWCRFNGHEHVADVLAGVKFNDGIQVTDDDNAMRDERVTA